jgi:hypothetical protein
VGVMGAGAGHVVINRLKARLPRLGHQGAP